MGKLQGGILGTAKNKVAGVVFYGLRGQQVARQYAIPANPNTSGQRTVRSAFAEVVSLAKQVKAAVIDTYWNARQKGKTAPGWSAFVGKNQKLYLQSTSFKECVLTDGNLESVYDIQITASQATGEIAVDWSSQIKTNGDASDKVFVIAYDETLKYTYISSEVARSDEEILLSPPDLTAGKKYIVWTIVHRASDNKLYNLSTATEVTAT